MSCPSHPVTASPAVRSDFFVRIGANITLNEQLILRMPKGLHTLDS